MNDSHNKADKREHINTSSPLPVCTQLLDPGQHQAAAEGGSIFVPESHFLTLLRGADTLSAFSPSRSCKKWNVWVYSSSSNPEQNHNQAKHKPRTSAVFIIVLPIKVFTSLLTQARLVWHVLNFLWSFDMAILKKKKKTWPELPGFSLVMCCFSDQKSDFFYGSVNTSSLTG